MITENKHQESVCSGEKIRKIFGLEFCADMYYPDAGDIEGAPAFPLTGPAGVSVSMYKRDVPNGYKVEVKTIEVHFHYIISSLCCVLLFLVMLKRFKGNGLTCKRG